MACCRTSVHAVAGALCVVLACPSVAIAKPTKASSEARRWEHQGERADAEETLRMLRAKLARSMRRVRVVSEPVGAKVRLESAKGTEEGLTPFDRWVPQGTYGLVVSKEGYEAHREDLELGAGEPLRRELRLVEVKEAAPEPAAKPARVSKRKRTAAPAAKAAAEAEKGGNALPWAVLSTGGALLAAGAVFGVLSWQAQGRVQEFRDEDWHGGLAEVQAEQDVAESRALVCNVLLAAVGMRATAGGVLLLAGRPGEAAVRLAPAPGGLAVTVGGVL